MRVLVCGGRDFDDLGVVWSALDTLHNLPRSMGGEGPVGVVLEGGAKGTDALARSWARSNNVKSELYPADWQLERKAAGPKRNQRMLDEGRPDLVLAFLGGRGTADMVRRARAAGVEVREVQP